jgi:hypothetical protein
MKLFISVEYSKAILADSLGDLFSIPKSFSFMLSGVTESLFIEKILWMGWVAYSKFCYWFCYFSSSLLCADGSNKTVVVALT